MYYTALTQYSLRRREYHGWLDDDIELSCTEPSFSKVMELYAEYQHTLDLRSHEFGWTRRMLGILLTILLVVSC